MSSCISIPLAENRAAKGGVKPSRCFVRAIGVVRARAGAQNKSRILGDSQTTRNKKWASGAMFFFFFTFFFFPSSSPSLPSFLLGSFWNSDDS